MSSESAELQLRQQTGAFQSAGTNRLDPSESNASFEAAVNAVTSLRDAEVQRKAETFRIRMSISELNIALQRLEAAWCASSSRSGAPALYTPSTLSTMEIDDEKSSVSSVLAELATRFDQMSESVSAALASAAAATTAPSALHPHLHTFDSPPSKNLQPQDANHSVRTSLSIPSPSITPTSTRIARSQVSLLVEEPPMSTMFSPKCSRKPSFTVSDSISFVPEAMLRPDAEDLVSRGTMTKFSVTSSSGTQTQQSGDNKTAPRTAAGQQLFDRFGGNWDELATALSEMNA